MRSFSMRITTGLILVVLAVLPRGRIRVPEVVRCLIKPSQVVCRIRYPVEGLIESVTVDQEI